MDGITLSRGALSREQCHRFAAAVDEKAGRITVPAEVGRLLGDVGTTQVPCKTATGPVREHLDRYADGSPVPGVVSVVYLEVDGACSLVLSPAGGGDEIRVVLEPGLRVAWENSKFQHRVDCAPDVRRVMLGPAARRGKDLLGVGDNGPPKPNQSLETPTQVTVFMEYNAWMMGALSTSMSRPGPFDPGFLAQRGVPPDIVAALAWSLGTVPTTTCAAAMLMQLLPPCWCMCIKARMDFENGLKGAVQAHVQAFANVGVQLSLEKRCLAQNQWQGPGLVFTFVNAAAPGISPPPGVQAMAGRPQAEMVPLVQQQRTIAVAVPPGTQPGAVITAQAPDGTVVQCTVPSPVPPVCQVAY